MNYSATTIEPDLKTVMEVTPLRDAVATWREAGERVALVPTMGNLHAGHLSLVARAREWADRVIVSIFVNPIQFGPNEDLDRYPRTPDADTAALEDMGTDLLFRPGVETVYPDGEAMATVHVGGLEDILCGASRPGHFAGVTTVVAKLFNMARPDVAVFGSKDYQQLVILRRMAAGLDFPVTVVGAPTVRESDGLAMSSRNRYLSDKERSKAPALPRALASVANELHAGARNIGALEAGAIRELKGAGLEPDYVSIRHPKTLTESAPNDNRFIVLGAAWLGRTRLIDNAA